MVSKQTLSVRLGYNEKLKLFNYSNYFYYYLWVSLHFLTLLIGHIVLFQLIFIFIYNTFSNNFSVLAKLAISKYTLRYRLGIDYCVQSTIWVPIIASMFGSKTRFSPPSFFFKPAPPMNSANRHIYSKLLMNSKILYYFQFSIFSKISGIQTHS